MNSPTLSSPRTDPSSVPRFPETAGFAWAAALLWCGVIFAGSSVPDYSGRDVDLETLGGIIHILSRKCAHLLEYGFLMVLLYRALAKTFPSARSGHLLGAFSLLMAFAASDEWHQTFVFGRTGSLLDLCIDAAGACAGLFLYARHRALKGDPLCG